MRWSIFPARIAGDASSSRKRVLLKGLIFPRRKYSVAPVSKRTTCSVIARKLGNTPNLSANVRTRTSCMVQTVFFLLERQKKKSSSGKASADKSTWICCASVHDFKGFLQLIEVRVLCKSKPITPSFCVILRAITPGFPQASLPVRTCQG